MKFHLNRIGDPAHPPLIMLHGFGVHRSIWDGLIPKLTAHFYVYCCDLPGYGDNLTVSISELHTVSDQMSRQLPDSAIWLGWSLGGLIALDVACRYPHRVAGVITICSSPCFIAQSGWPGLDPDYFEHFYHALITYPQKTFAQFQLLQAHGDKKSRQIISALQRCCDHPVSESAWQEGLQLLHKTDLRTALSTLKVPYLALFGKQDKIVPAAVAEKLVAYSNTITCYVIDEAAHVPFLSQPDTVLSHLIPFSQKRFIRYD